MTHYTDILDEWDEGCFYTTSMLAEAFLTLLSQLPSEDFTQTPPDPRLSDFLEVGYHAFLEGVARLTVRPNPLVHVTYSMAKRMLGAGVTTRSARRQADALHDEGAATSPHDTDTDAVNMIDIDGNTS